MQAIFSERKYPYNPIQACSKLFKCKNVAPEANMETHNDKIYLKKLRKAIEQKSGWGDSSQWTTQDFQTLNEAILEATQVNLSVTTLKRVLGKVQYNAQPRVSTLDALSQFLGHQDWRSFKQTKTDSNTTSQVYSSSVGGNPTFRFSYKMLLIIVLILGTIGGLIALTNRPDNYKSTAEPPAQSNARLIANTAHFRIKKISKGLPNTVVFDFGVDESKVKKIQIQQSWDPSKRIDVQPGQQQATCMYYYPGFYRAKLVVNDKILKKQNLFIESDGWVAALDRPKGKPEYMLADDLIKQNTLRVSERIRQRITQFEKPHTLNYCYFQDFGQLSGSDFTFETGFRHTLRSGKLICQQVKVSLVGTKGAVILPFAIPGCVGELGLYLNGERVKGATNDLSGFGCDFSTMQHLQVINQRNLMLIYLNKQLIWTQRLKYNLGNMVGVRYRFIGDGEIDYVRYYRANGEVAFQEEFESNRKASGTKVKK
ncbi:MAG TPA: hypothetical protein DCS93_21655 [Microscillaceae bacterium]|nr:hypothetical protein [Microscillaceae bacterium]